jgi:transcriptional regulator with XRE-family HTH domain
VPKGNFDLEAFFAAVDAVRRDRDWTWKRVANDAGVSPSTLTRMAQGRRPDVDGLAALVQWSGLNADDFIRTRDGGPEEAPVVARISTYLRADPNLTPESARALETIIETAYRQMRKDASDETGVQDRG